jgi:hypothetical protein
MSGVKFWRLEVQMQGVGRAVPPEAGRDDLFMHHP